jgi:hypothetical protein
VRPKPSAPLLDVLAKNYQFPHFAFMREFRDATGFDAIRSADALAFGMYVSRGQVIIGFEVKVSRSDWLRELKDPAKADPIARYCDYFNLVVPATGPGVCAISELPSPWGLIQVDVEKARTKIIKKAEKLDAAPITRSFLCAIVKQAMDSIGVPGQTALNQARDEGFREGQKLAEENSGYRMKQLADLEEQVNAFREKSGIDINSYSEGKQLGEAVMIVRKMMRGDRDAIFDLEQAEEALKHSLKQVQGNIAHLKSLVPKES